MNKKSIIRVIGFVVICIAILVALTFAMNTGFRHEEPLVYVTCTGEKYHSGGCGYLWSSAIPMGLNQAKNAGYTVCSRCGGKAIDTITVNNYGASFAISFLIICVMVVLGFVIYNKATTSPEGQNDSCTEPQTKSTQIENISNKTSSTISTNVVQMPKQNISIKCGDIVIHKSFGRGKVIDISNKYIAVQFSNKIKEFVFPNAFTEGFLTKDKTD